MRLTDVLIFVKPPNEEPAIINTSSTGLLRSGYPSAIEAIKLGWNRPAGYASQAAASANLRMVGDEQLIGLLTWDARVDILAVIQGDPAPWRTLFIGWITQTSRTPARDGLFNIQVTLTNIFGRAAGTRLGARPWAQQSTAQRLTAINTASPVGPLAAVEAPPWDKQPRAALDVDSKAALDVIEATVDPTVTLEEAGDGLIHSVVSIGSRVKWPTAFNDLAVAGPIPEPVPLSASAVHDSARVTDRTGLITHVTIEAKSPSLDSRPKPGELPKYDSKSQTWYNSEHGRQSANHRITTDALVDAAAPMPRPWQIYAAGLATEGAKPGERLEQASLVPSRLDPLSFGKLTGIDTRAGAYIEISDAPSDVEIAQRPISGSLSIHADSKAEGDSGVSGLRFNRLPAPAPKHLEDWQVHINSKQTMHSSRVELELGLEPTRLSGVNLLAFSEIPDSAFITFSRAGKATIRQLCYVDRILEAPATLERPSRRFLNVSIRAAFNQTTAKIAEYSYLDR